MKIKVRVTAADLVDDVADDLEEAAPVEPTGAEAHAPRRKTSVLRSAGRRALDNPLTRALRRVTSTRWCIFRDGCLAHELERPYRVLRLPFGITFGWRVYRSLGVMQPVEFEADTAPADVPILRQGERRQGERRRVPRPGDRRHSERRALPRLA